MMSQQYVSSMLGCHCMSLHFIVYIFHFIWHFWHLFGHLRIARDPQIQQWVHGFEGRWPTIKALVSSG